MIANDVETVTGPQALTEPCRVHPEDVGRYLRVLDGMPVPRRRIVEQADGSWRPSDEQAVDDGGRPEWELGALFALVRYGRVEWTPATVVVTSDAPPPAQVPFGPLEAQDVRVDVRVSKAGRTRVTVTVGRLGASVVSSKVSRG